MPARYAYSLNGENYTGTFAARDEALAAGIDAARESLDPPQTIFVARRVEADPHASGHARTVLREMAWQAHDEVGASATSYLHKLSDDQVNELDLAIEKVVLEWLRRNELLPTYFKVEAISEHPVPQPPARALKTAEGSEVNQVGETLDAPQ
jgi:hypothetical protein